MDSIKDSIRSLVQSLPKSEEADYKQLKRFTMLLYVKDDHIDCESVLESIRSWDRVDSWSYALHDSDFFKEDTYDGNGRLVGKQGQHKQDHYHVYVCMRSKISICDISSHLNIPQRFIQNLKDLDGGLLYQTHRKNPEKHQYPFEVIQSNILDYNRYLYDNYVPSKTVYEYLFDYIDSVPLPSKRGFVRYMMDYEQEGWLRKYWGVIRDVINESREPSSYLPKVLIDEEMEKRKTNEYIKRLCELSPSGLVSIESENGVVKQICLSEDGSLDILGFKFPDHL